LRVLLLGEYSGLHNCLKDGLRHCEVHADVATDGDGWKNFPADLNFASPFTPRYLPGRIYKNLKPFMMMSKFHEYDLVQFINPMVLSPRFGINSAFVDRVLAHCQKSYLVAAGDDCYYHDIVHTLKYNPVDESTLVDHPGQTPWAHARMRYANDKLVQHVRRVIPVAYDYWVGYSHNPKCNAVIPMPVNIEKYKYTPNCVDHKIVFYHGINRPGFKGTRFIREAFERMEHQYGHCAEFIVADRVPINEYITLIERANVIVDQALTYCYGMNALISMAKGKLVMSGAEDEIFPFYKYGPCPIINIRPDVQQICEQIEWVLANRDKITELGENSRRYVEMNHSHLVIAEEFLKVWTS
jgi:hypothetical protein